MGIGCVVGKVVCRIEKESRGTDCSLYICYLRWRFVRGLLRWLGTIDGRGTIGRKVFAFCKSEGERDGLLSLDAVDEPKTKASQTYAQYRERM